MSSPAPRNLRNVTKSPVKTGLSASKSAADSIREMILSGQLVPGQRVPPEREFAQMFGYSRSSVREAVRELAALGILSARQGDGTYVSTLESNDLFAPLEFALRVDQKSMLDLTELRLIIEPRVAATAAARLTPEQIETLKDALAGYAREVDSGRPDSEALIRYDETIHSTLIDAAGNALLAAIVRSLESVVRKGRELTVALATAPSESLTELRAVVDAVIARDPGRAEAAMTWHVVRWAERIRHEVQQAATARAVTADGTQS